MKYDPLLSGDIPNEVPGLSEEDLERVREVVARRWPPEIVLQSSVVDISGQHSDGAIITACCIPWLEILEEIERDPHF